MKTDMVEKMDRYSDPAMKRYREAIEPYEYRGFFKNPDRVRQVAMQQQYYRMDDHPMGGNYPGFRTMCLNNITPDIFSEVANRLYEVLGFDDSRGVHLESMFQWCNKADQPPEWVHRDNLYFDPNTVGIVYLHPNPPPNSGTELYTLKDEYEYRDSFHDHPERYKYNVMKTFKNEYNKLILYDPLEYHDSLDCFGETIDDSRMWMMFFAKIEV